ncbi:MAG TPA: TonB-dependent receptor [Bryobacteraceae bacterium]|nr:TonB-dependent receptor [Bryobacteraceae bacterium]
MQKLSRAFLTVSLAVVLGVALSSPTFAQQVFGSIYGTVTDATGGAVVNAKVTIADVNKGTKFEITTDSNGNYNKGQLIPDPYKVSIEAPGFQRVTSNDIDVRVDEAARYDVSLKVGEVTTAVEVVAQTPLLQSDRADIAQTFTTKEIEDLPNIGRNVQSMTLLEPGSAKFGWQHASDENPQNSIQMVVDGQLFSQMGYELDGTTNQDPILGIIVINPNIDSLAEIKQSVQNFDAEFHMVGGGVASYSTKSGTNDFHGSAFEYNQVNTSGFTTVARNPFSNVPSPLYRQNQFGGSIGGPVIKNKLFFFGDTELNRQFQGGTVITSVPDALSRAGNFSEWLAYNKTYEIFDPKTGDPNTGVGRIPFSNNTIPSSELSPQALKIMSYWPSANIQQIPNAPFVNNYTVNGGTTIGYEKWDTREDYYLNEKNSIFGRFSYANFSESAPGAFGALAGGPAFVNYGGSSSSRDYSLAVGWTNTHSATLINELRFGWFKYFVFDVPNGYGTSPATDAGIPNLNLDKTYTSGMPYFNVSTPNDSMQLGYALGTNQCNCPLTQNERQYQFIDNLSKTMGKHTFKFGADIRFALNLRVPSDSHRAGELNFNAGQTGNVPAVGEDVFGGIGLASFLLGDVGSFARYVSTSTNAQERQKRFFWYGQDAWRPTPKWTLNFGLRWEMVFPETVNAAANGATLNLNNGLMYVFGAGGVSSHGIQNMMWHNFAPRAAFAYQIRPKTVIRGGFGWSYDLGVFGSIFGHNVTQNPPVLSYQSLNPPNGFTDVFTLAQGPPSPSGFAVSSNGTFPLPSGINPKFRPDVMTLPQIYQYNLTVQHQLTNQISLQGAYVGNVDRHAFYGTSNNTLNPNEPIFQPGISATNTLDRPYYSKFGWTNDLSYFCDCSNAHYNSFQGLINIRAWQGWTLQASYTYQQSIAAGGGYDGNYYELYGPRSLGYGNPGFLAHQQWTFAQNYDVPFGKGRKWGSNLSRAADALLGGWELSGITTYYSGFPFSPTLENYGSQGGQPNVGPNNRPEKGSGDPFAGAKGNRDQFFVGCPNQDCTSGPFLFPGANTFGNFPIGALDGPHFIQQDLSIFKTFKLTERWAFTLRTDSRNVFNHTNLGGPNSDVQSPSAGQITGIAAGGYMRQLQFSGTIRF